MILHGVDPHAALLTRAELCAIPLWAVLGGRDAVEQQGVILAQRFLPRDQRLDQREHLFLEIRILIGMLGEQPSVACRAFAVARDDRPFAFRHDRLQPFGIVLVDMAKPTPEAPADRLGSDLVVRPVELRLAKGLVGRDPDGERPSDLGRARLGAGGGEGLRLERSGRGKSAFRLRP